MNWGLGFDIRNWACARVGAWHDMHLETKVEVQVKRREDPSMACSHFFKHSMHLFPFLLFILLFFSIFLFFPTFLIHHTTFWVQKNFNGTELTEQHSLKHYYCICNNHNFQINNTFKKKGKVRVFGRIIY